MIIDVLQSIKLICNFKNPINNQSDKQKIKFASMIEPKGYTKFLEKDEIKKTKRLYYPTNNVFIDYSSKTIFLPGFLRLKFKNFNEMDIGGLSAVLNGEIILVIYYGELFNVFGTQKDKQVQQCLMKEVVLLFARDNAIKLIKDEQKNQELQLDIKAAHNKEKHEVKFIIKKKFKLYLDSDVFYTPFEVINGILEITVQSVSLEYPMRGKENTKSNYSKFKVQFNLQNNSNIEEKVSFANWGTFGNYDLAEKRIGAIYTNYRISQQIMFRKKTQEREKIQKNKQFATEMQTDSEKIIDEFKKIIFNTGDQSAVFDKTNLSNISNVSYSDKDPITLPIHSTQKQTKIEAFHYAYFNIPLYKFPLSAVITIFMPLFFLDVLNFGILFQDSGLGDRMAAIAALVLAFAALIPTIRSQIPPNPRITLIQILVYFQTLPTILAIIQSLNVSELQSGDEQNPAPPFNLDWLVDGFFWVAFIVSISTFLIILVLIALHYCKWYPEYNDVAQRGSKPQFDRTRWRNTQCNRYFDNRFYQQKDEDKKVVIISKKLYSQKVQIKKSTFQKLKKLLKKISKEDQIIGRKHKL